MSLIGEVRKELGDVELKLEKIKADKAAQKLKADQAAKRIERKEARAQMRVDAKQAFIYRQAETQQDIYLGRLMRSLVMPGGPANDTLREHVVKGLKDFIQEDDKRAGALSPLLAVIENPPSA
jgi:hypothetical protein